MQAAKGAASSDHCVKSASQAEQVGAFVDRAARGEADVIGISSLATDHLIVPDLTAALRDAGLSHVAVIVGGIGGGAGATASALPLPDSP